MIRPLTIALSQGLLLLFGCAQADAAVIWRLGSISAPTYLPQGQEGVLIASASNLGETALTQHRAPADDHRHAPAGLQVPSGTRWCRARSACPAAQPTEPEQCAVAEPERREVSCKTAARRSRSPLSGAENGRPGQGGRGRERHRTEHRDIQRRRSRRSATCRHLLRYPAQVVSEPTPFGVER